MILVDKYWEKVETLDDVSKIIREYYNSELADELDRMIDDVEYEISDLKDRIDELED